MGGFELDELHLLTHISIRLGFKIISPPFFNLHLMQCIFKKDHGVFVLYLVQEEISQFLQLVD